MYGASIAPRRPLAHHRFIGIGPRMVGRAADDDVAIGQTFRHLVGRKIVDQAAEAIPETAASPPRRTGAPPPASGACRPSILRGSGATLPATGRTRVPYRPRPAPAGAGKVRHSRKDRQVTRLMPQDRQSPRGTKTPQPGSARSSVTGKWSEASSSASRKLRIAQHSGSSNGCQMRQRRAEGAGRADHDVVQKRREPALVVRDEEPRGGRLRRDPALQRAFGMGVVELHLPGPPMHDLHARAPEQTFVVVEPRAVVQIPRHDQLPLRAMADRSAASARCIAPVACGGWRWRGSWPRPGSSRRGAPWI
jgi:hypothetical protein